MKKFLLADTVTDLEGIAGAFKEIMQKVVGPVLSVIGVVAVAYLIVLGIQYAKAEDAEGRKKVQGRLVGAAVGAIIIVAGIVLCFAIDWATLYKNWGSGFISLLKF